MSQEDFQQIFQIFQENFHQLIKEINNNFPDEYVKTMIVLLTMGYLLLIISKQKPKEIKIIPKTTITKPLKDTLVEIQPPLFKGKKVILKKLVDGTSYEYASIRSCEKDTGISEYMLNKCNKDQTKYSTKVSSGPLSGFEVSVSIE